MVKKISAREAYERFTIDHEIYESNSSYISDIPAKRNETVYSASIALVLFLLVMWTGIFNCLDSHLGFWMFNFSMSFIVAMMIKMKTKFWHMQWWKTTIRVIYYHGRAFSDKIQQQKKAILGLAVIVFCNLTPIAIESLWNPGVTAYMNSQEHANDLMGLSSASLNPLGGASFLFLEAQPNYAVVNESNGWEPYQLGGQSHWFRSFSANGSSYMSVTVQGATSMNISLIYPDFERVNYTALLGENVFPLYFGNEIAEYEISVTDACKSYLTSLVIQPLWIQPWTQVNVKFSGISSYDPIPDNFSPDYVYTKSFFAHGPTALYLYAPDYSYNSLFIEVDGHIVQYFQDGVNAQNDSEYLSTQIVAEFSSKGHALEYSLPLTNMYEHSGNYEWYGFHTIKIAISHENNNVADWIDNATVEFAIVSHTLSDFDGDGLSNAAEINTYYDMALDVDFPNTFAYWNVVPEEGKADIFKSNWSSASLHIQSNQVIPGYLYIDICSNESAYMNFTIDGQPIQGGALQGYDIRFTEDGWWSIWTEKLLQAKTSYTVDFMYDTRASLPKDALVFIINGEIIPILDIAPRYLSESLIDSDNDGLIDSKDKSQQASWTVDGSKMWRLVTDIQKDSDSEINFQIKVPSSDLYALTHNTSYALYQWNDESVITISPALRIYSNLIGTNCFDTVDYTYNSQNLQLNHGSDQQNMAWTKLKEMTLGEFLAYYSDLSVEDMNTLMEDIFINEAPSSINGSYDYELLNAFSEISAIKNYNLSQFGDAPPSDWNLDGVLDTSPLDSILSIEEWFQYYVNNIAYPMEHDYCVDPDGYEPSNLLGEWTPNSFYSEDVIRFYYNMFTSIRSPSVEYQLIDLTADSDTYEASFFIPSGHISKWDNCLDLMLQPVYKVEDLNIFDRITREFGETGDGTGTGADRVFTEVTAFNLTSQIMTLKTTHWNWADSHWQASSPMYTYVNFDNSSIWFPTIEEVDALLNNNTYIDSYSDWASIADGWDSQTAVDDTLLDTKFGKYNDMKDIVGSILPPGTKIYAKGSPKLMRVYPWESHEDTIIQSISLTEHEQVDYILASPDSTLENTLFQKLVQNKNLWDLNNPIFNSAQGGINLTDDVYGEPCIKTTNQLSLMINATNDFEQESQFGMGWGHKTYGFDTLTTNQGVTTIDSAFTVTGTTSWVYSYNYQSIPYVIEFGDLDSDRIYREWIYQYGNYFSVDHPLKNSFNGSVLKDIGHNYANGTVSFDIAVKHGVGSFVLKDSSGVVGLKLTANVSISNNWSYLLPTGLYGDTNISFSGDWQRIDVIFSTISHNATILIDGTPIKVQLLNNIESIRNIAWDYQDFYGYMDSVYIPAYVQMGTQSKILYTNTIYSIRDLTKDIIYNALSSYYCGEFFNFNGSDYFLRYLPDSYLYELYYAPKPEQFYDSFAYSLDLTTFDFDQTWLNGNMHPFFGFVGITPQNYQSKLDGGVFKIFDDVEGITKISAPIAPFLNGSVAGSLYACGVTDGGVLASLDVLNISVSSDGTAIYSRLDSRIEIGVVGNKFAYRVSGSAWNQTSIICNPNSWYDYRIDTYNSSTGIWHFNITIDDQTIVASQTIAMQANNPGLGDMFGYISYYANTYQLWIDNVSVSTMQNVYRDLNVYGYSANSGSVFAVMDYMNSLNSSIAPALMVHDSIVRRNLPTSTDSGVLSFAAGVTDDSINASVTLFESPTEGISLIAFNGYWHLQGYEANEFTLINLSIPVIEGVMDRWRIIFGQSTLFNQTDKEVSLWYNDMFIGKFDILASISRSFLGVAICALDDQFIFVNELAVGDIPDVKANDGVMNFVFQGYWHDELPSSFLLNRMTFEKSIRWNGVYKTDSGTIFAYIDINHVGQRAVNYTDPIQWRYEDWGFGFTIPIAQFWNSSNQWEDGIIDTELSWANRSSINKFTYRSLSEVDEFGAKITAVTVDNLTINGYTEFMDWAVNNASDSPYDSNFDIVYDLEDLIIMVPSSSSYGFDNYSRIVSPTDYLKYRIIVTFQIWIPMAIFSTITLKLT